MEYSLRYIYQENLLNVFTIPAISQIYIYMERESFCFRYRKAYLNPVNSNRRRDVTKPTMTSKQYVTQTTKLVPSVSGQWVNKVTQGSKLKTVLAPVASLSCFVFPRYRKVAETYFLPCRH